MFTTQVYNVTNSLFLRSIFSTSQLSNKKILYCMYKTLHAFSSIYIFTMVHYDALGEEHFFELVVRKIFLFCI